MSTDIVSGLVAGSVFMLLAALLLVILIVRYRQKQFQNRRLISRLETQFQQELLKTQLEIREQTLKNVSMEIHDNLGQTLSLAKLNLNTINLHSESAAGKIANTRELVGKAISDLRILSKTLNPDSMLVTGFLKAIEYDLQMIEKSGSFTTALRVGGKLLKPGPDKELILFRIVQECIGNIIRHAAASKIDIEVCFSPTGMSIRVSDDGKGFDPAEVEGAASGSGLRNMKSRAELIGGKISIESAEAEGTTINITLPITGP